MHLPNFDEVELEENTNLITIVNTDQFFLDYHVDILYGSVKHWFVVETTLQTPFLLPDSNLNVMYELITLSHPYQSENGMACPPAFFAGT